MLEILIDSLLDTLKAFPYLLGAYLLIEWLAHKAKETLKKGLTRFGALGSVGGSVLGLVPQCGFSVVAANFYADRMITPGTLLAVFLATSDEAIPVLLSEPHYCKTILPLLAIKFLVAMVTGLVIDFAFKRYWRPLWERDSELRHNHHKHHEHDKHEEDNCKHNHCQGSVWKIAVVHSLKVPLFIFIVTVLLNMALEALGQERVEAFLLHGSVFQPILAAIFGLIPSCASSVFLTRLYLEGSITFGSAIAGLLTGAGTGILILAQALKRKTEFFLILTALVVVGSMVGLIIG